MKLYCDDAVYFKLPFLSEIISRQLINLGFQIAIRYFILKKFCFTSRSRANLLTAIADRIVLKTSGATLVLKAFHRVCHTVLLYRFRLYGIMKRFTLLSYFVAVKDLELF